MLVTESLSNGAFLGIEHRFLHAGLLSYLLVRYNALQWN